ncbi:MAG: hypothetical protein Greene101449_547, partial [Candidatus Peregrinibacteria bacterium Greene1014_49]
STDGYVLSNYYFNPAFPIGTFGSKYIANTVNCILITTIISAQGALLITGARLRRTFAAL